jgi:hypothetical protein
MKVVVVADVASTNDISESILAQALVGKLAGADASESSTIRNTEVVVVSSSPGNSGNNGQASDDAGSSETLEVSSNSISINGGGLINSSLSSPAVSLIQSKSLLPRKLLYSKQSLPATQIESSGAISRLPRKLADTDRVNVTFHVVGSLSTLGYQNADAFEVCLFFII